MRNQFSKTSTALTQSLTQSLAPVMAALITAASLTACGVQPAVSPDGRIVSRNEVLQLDTSQASVQISTSDLLSLNMGLVYDILPPAVGTTGGNQTYASDLVIANGYAFTAFNTVGVPQAGAIDSINLNLEIMNPSMVTSKSFTDFDVNAVRYYPAGQLLANGQLLTSGQLWLSGALQDIGAQFKTFPVDALTSVIGTQTLTNTLRGYAGTGFTQSSGVLYAASGDNAGIDKVDPGTGAITQFINQTDARDLIPIGTGGDFVVLSGQPGLVTRYNASGSSVWTAAIGGNTIAQSKSTLVAGSTYIAASMGDGGFALICAADGKIMATAPALVVSGIPAAKSVTNSVAFASGVVITGNGEAGVAAYLIQNSTVGPASSCAKVSLGLMGRSAFSTGSANKVTAGNFNYSLNILNGVKTYSGRVYVASGINGFRTVSVSYQFASGSTIITP
ncbi:MAG: hypothetical protein EOP09_06965 [Proteobacteria bacterium]|nr:MAG: hypothetical protein EOP09_06965 [Pseudomonadota bacterium]